MAEVKVLDKEAEKKEILKRYRSLLRACKPTLEKGDKELIRRAFDIALEAHSNMRRRSGEPYIYHPIAVAQIAAEEIGLGTTSIICALLHDTVEDTEITLEQIEDEFGPKVSQIIDGLTKISGVFDQSSSLQAENFRKMLLTLSDDVRVILLKLADRLHNMRTLNVMPRDKQLKITSETAYLYAPLAHRLGLYAIKTELDDLVLKYTEPDVYNMIRSKLSESRKEREKFITVFNEPLNKAFSIQDINCTIKGRTKSIHSIWNKMKKQGVPFEEIYDIFAIRIIIDTPFEKEKADCWKVYSIVTDFYVPNPDRLRDWVSTPKGNGYESLHTTVMSSKGKWVEVQIRTERMDEIAEKGYAAHWKYKESSSEGALDEWIGKVREILENPDSNALDFMDDFKLNLFSDEIFVFTPNGDLKKLPLHATALDFAFEIHSDVGAKCIGAKVNNKLVPISHEMASGDQVEILTSNKQNPKEDWLSFVKTAKAKSKIKSALREEKKKLAEDGKEIFDRKLRQLKLNIKNLNINNILLYYKVPSLLDFHFKIAKGAIDLKELQKVIDEKLTRQTTERKSDESVHKLIKDVKGSKGSTLVIGDNEDKFEYTLAPCCNPIAGDHVFGFITINDGIKIHRTNCPNAVQLMSNYGYRIVKARWTDQSELAFLVGIKVTGIDDVGVVNKITKVISSGFKVNIRSISIESEDGIFEGIIMLYVHDRDHLKKLSEKLAAVTGIISVTRIETDD
ncbi:MAG: bifunctional (p)ppGpp synthetase/guanosine-3',5'-bis(diphosphate) 3'-pyrophosphohydrolase [Bacteroidia bacterium]|nr:RelA/SpoT family protein [Bacteroidia bacterium]NNC84895.1 bifunctional (p)ppGpp synthetase/guanosine-3',5'-bis(diphosphate) 3'-pyrophosphohydrolase [Bacteroidia bacterium]NNM15301.1 bifunctional (p)ppGpp synthetase/guanosine-3',5'-bis(diphosphate) 3'-pyrophosphohydrolase [Bacteroidia bacterium]